MDYINEHGAPTVCARAVRVVDSVVIITDVEACNCDEEKNYKDKMLIYCDGDAELAIVTAISMRSSYPELQNRGSNGKTAMPLELGSGPYPLLKSSQFRVLKIDHQGVIISNETFSAGYFQFEKKR